MIDAPVVLILAYIMPGRQPDIQQELPYQSIEECVEDELIFLKRGVPEIVRKKGAVAVLAACRAKVETGEEG